LPGEPRYEYWLRFIASGSRKPVAVAEEVERIVMMT
jgi:hypothetical protein